MIGSGIPISQSNTPFPKVIGNLHLINQWSDNAATFHLFPPCNPLPGLMIRWPLLIWTESTDSVFSGIIFGLYRTGCTVADRCT
jgi:hypothetical protein